MYSVELYGRARLAALREGMSGREAARVLGIDRGTGAKILRHSAPPSYQRVMEVRRPKLTDHVGFSEQILDEDERVPRKQGHTAQRIFKWLRDERGYASSYWTIRDDLRPRRQGLKEVFVPLHHPPCHAQAVRQQ